MGRSAIAAEVGVRNFTRRFQMCVSESCAHREMDRRMTVRTVSGRGTLSSLGIGTCGVIRDDSCASHTISKIM